MSAVRLYEWLSFSAVLGASFFARAAHADERCIVQLESPASQPAWSAAVGELEALVADEAGDCRRIRVVVQGAGALVELETQDGRTATRRIARASELEPLVQALLVASPVDAAPREATSSEESSAAQPQANIARPEEPAAADVVRDAKPKDEDETTRLLVAAGAGLRTDAEGGRVAPTAQVTATVAVGRWEIGGFGRFEAERGISGDSSLRPRAEAFGGGIVAGRRETVGPVWLVYGGNVGLYASEIEQRRGDASVTARSGRLVEDESTQPRLGVFFGAVFPRSARFRLRAQVDADLALARGAADASGLPKSPQWGLGFTLGVETRFLP